MSIAALPPRIRFAAPRDFPTAGTSNHVRELSPAASWHLAYMLDSNIMVELHVRLEAEEDVIGVYAR